MGVLLRSSHASVIVGSSVYPAIEFRLLRYVVAVAEELHFGRAALREHVTQPSLSRQIRDFEASLGVSLFDRTNHEVALTQAGQIFVEEAIQALAHSERAIHLARQADPDTNGGLDIGYTPGINLRLWALIRSLCLKHNREFTVNFRSEPSQEQMQHILLGHLQAGFVILPLRNKSLVVRSIVREPLVLAIPVAHPFAIKREIHASELSGLPFIMRARHFHPASYDHFQKVLRNGGCRPRIVQEVATEAESLLLVKEGLGFAFVRLSFFLRERHDLTYLLISDIPLFEEIGLVYRRDNRSQRLQDFLLVMKNNGRYLADQCVSSNGDPAMEPLSDPRQLRLF